MKIYTKTGDEGKTSLFGGKRVDKNDIRIEAYGTVDELNSFIGLLLSNIQENNQVCLSFIDVFVQKGFQLKGTAEIVTKEDTSYPHMRSLLEEMLQGQYPYKTITRVRVAKVKKIIAPRYFLYPETTEEDQIRSAKKTYGVA